VNGKSQDRLKENRGGSKLQHVLSLEARVARRGFRGEYDGLPKGYRNKG